MTGPKMGGRSEWIVEFADPELFDEAISNIFARLSNVSAEKLKTVVDNLVLFIEPLRRIKQVDVQIEACCNALTIFSNSGPPQLAQRLFGIREILKQAWARIGDDRLRIETGYRISSSLAPFFREEAAQYLSEADSLRRTRAVDISIPSYILCVRIAIRAFSGLLGKHFDSPDDFSQLVSQIQRVASDKSRIFLWADCRPQSRQRSRQ